MPITPTPVGVNLQYGAQEARGKAWDISSGGACLLYELNRANRILPEARKIYDAKFIHYNSSESFDVKLEILWRSSFSSAVFLGVRFVKEICVEDTFVKYVQNA